VALGALLVFGCLAPTPSNKCCCCLLTKFGLAQSKASFRRLAHERCLAFNIFDALSMHTFAAAYSGPIQPTAGHDSLRYSSSERGCGTPRETPLAFSI